MDKNPQNNNLVSLEHGAEFTRLLVENQSRLRAFVFSLTGDSTATDDVLQEASTTLWRKFNQFEAGSDFTAWAFATARYSVLEWRRKQSRLPLPIDEDTLQRLADEAGECFHESEGLRETLRLCLTKLPGRQHQVLKARYFEDLSVETISKQWNRTRMAIYKLLRKSHAQLLTCIEKHA